jgi:uncharacterized DUF497 family protein
MRHGRFESDVRKAKQNQRKHRVSFDDAELVLGDVFWHLFHVEEYDDEASVTVEEDRVITTGSLPDDRHILLRIVWTPRPSPDGIITRRISARYPTTKERRQYEEEIATRLKGQNPNDC